MPVAQSWFEGKQLTGSEADAKNVRSADDKTGSEAPGTPIPVLAGWFHDDDEEMKKVKLETIKPHTFIEPNVSKEEKKLSSPSPIPVPPPMPPITPILSPKKAKKHVDFAEPLPISPDSEVSSLQIEEMSDLNESCVVEERRNVKDSIKMFQGGFSRREEKSVDVDFVKGRVNESKKAFMQRTTSLEREDTERNQRQRELEEVAKARSMTNWEENRVS